MNKIILKLHPVKPQELAKENIEISAMILKSS